MGVRGEFNPELSFEAMEAASQPGFGAWLLSAAQRVAQIDEVYAYRFTRSGGPRALVSSGHDPQAGDRAALYANRFHPYDPMLKGVGAHQAGFVHVKARDIAHDDYRHYCFDLPRFIDKLSFRWVRQDEAYFVSFYRRAAGGDEALPALAKLADIGLSALVRSTHMAAPARPAPLVERIAEKLAAAYPALTQRERDVCARSLCGESAREIAGALGVKPSSVLTYRQRAYAKYDVSSVSAFLDRLIMQ
jgi:DNA-binding CsgD family transcriptional regulator